MDRNSIIGLLLIGGILIGWMFLSKPSAEELAKRQQLHDSIALYEKTAQTKADAATKGLVVSGAADSTGVVSDSVKATIQKQIYGDIDESEC